jgi:predicted nucleotidyltransferase
MSGLEALTTLLGRRPDVRLAYVFGSVPAGQAQRGSDLDVAVLFSSSPSPATLDLLAEELEAVSGRPIDLVDLATAPPLLGHEIIRSGRCIVCRDAGERGEFEARVTLRYLDTAHLRRIQDEYLHERVEARRGGAG